MTLLCPPKQETFFRNRLIHDSIIIAPEAQLNQKLRDSLIAILHKMGPNQRWIDLISEGVSISGIGFRDFKLSIMLCWQKF